jgi:hypothetical protein
MPVSLNVKARDQQAAVIQRVGNVSKRLPVIYGHFGARTGA